MKTLFILNEAPYGRERNYNGLRLAFTLAKREEQVLKIFLIGDAVACAKKNQNIPQGHYNIELMLKGVVSHNAEIGICGTCMDARGITEAELAEGMRSNLEQLTDWTVWADKVIVF